ncbi:hypothetical protein PACTADRAFT_74122 [Pachysolen tannophilus NRRL Y-2460]|uniref:J domain-containing protein n=1 Tax=Pachysolen tannophilus NRRL Y-2460 TaxID=669874 RepID=A0A1E4U3U8_PACTA|nr:hypothetical protein PACTADRAFT_74122 [Pachysolen tannophilus NRRL Y-2460]
MYRPFLIQNRFAHSIDSNSCNNGGDNGSVNHEREREREREREHLRLLKAWPKKLYPTPYEVFNISPSEFDPVLLKKAFYKFAKLYHPDSNHLKFQAPAQAELEAPREEGNTINNELKKELKEYTPELLSERFKTVLSAYQLLKNPSKKSLYDNHNIGWKSPPKNPNNSTNNMSSYSRGYPNSSPFASNRTSFQSGQDFKEHNYYYAGTWEDFQNMKNNKNNEFNKENFEKNKYQILIGIIAIASISTGLQLFNANEANQANFLIRNDIHGASQSDLKQAYDNYGMGLDKFSRINRFLWFRKIGDILFSGGSIKNKRQREAQEQGKDQIQQAHLHDNSIPSIQVDDATKKLVIVHDTNTNTDTMTTITAK